MKRIFLVVISIFFAGKSFSQAAQDTLPAYTRLVIPPFKINVLPDSSSFTKDMLKEKKSTIIMYFSPDCGHCEHSTKEMLAHYSELKNVQIIMVTSLGYEHALKFYNEMKIADYPAVTLGVDPSYFIGSFYQIKMFPAIFLYNKKGKFKKEYGSDAKWEDIAKDL